MTGDYLRAIEGALLTRTGGLMLSAIDLQHIRRWARAGVPAEVVIEGIEAAFEKNPRTTRGLSYAAKAVDDAVRVWTERRVGGRDTVIEAAAAEAEVKPALERLLRRVVDAGLRHDASIRMVLRDIYRQINALDPQADPVTTLAEIAEAAHDALWAVLDASAQALLTQQVVDAGVELTRARRWRAVRTHLALPDLALDLGGAW
ncbi:MAG: hypothetical protein ACI9U2_005055 [Bradymonadia bacterium]|jgi:hypothetical protein